MVRYGVDDFRLFYEGGLSFVKQFTLRYRYVVFSCMAAENYCRSPSLTGNWQKILTMAGLELNA